MAREIEQVWSALKTTSKDAHALADFMNQGLGRNNELIVISLTETWFVIAGNEVARKWFREMSDEMTRQNKLKST